ncbi:MAG: hypothetical protein D8M58_18520 [Calditrichaeota bacterium]|nr:MAG: hypothetical protein DWQ03_11750 [Calditrichota bacterium]MBL1207405.1 hypothetical protein [Calditrichota bacterium]NOG47237.1 hypothetical protein [Calditrichota bacterium]
MWLKKGVRLLEEEQGIGAPVEYNQYYLFAIRITLNRGEIVQHPDKCLGHQLDDYFKIEKDGYFQFNARYHRENFVGGIFYAMRGMKVGGFRKVVIGPHLAFGEVGIPDIIPKNAKLRVEIKVLDLMAEH